MQLSNAVRQRILQISKDNNQSLKEISRISNVPYSTLISFMIGKTKTLTLSTLFDLCNGMNTNLYDFFDSSIFKDVVDEHEKRLKSNV